MTAAALEPNPYESACPTRTILDRIGDRWTVLVLLLLADRTHRFTELSRAIRGISPKVLTSTLRSLERDGLITREVYAEVPPRTEYSLTPLGGTLVEAVSALEAWARTHIDDVMTARSRFDAR
ncbi:MAG: winged helix-turn-helix transcriptional regulator [Nocardioides sp.]